MLKLQPPKPEIRSSSSITDELDKATPWRRWLNVAFRFRSNFLHAVQLAQSHKFPPLLDAVKKMPVNKELLACTGIGWLVADSLSWPEPMRPAIQEVAYKWKIKIRLQCNERSCFDGWTRVRIGQKLMPLKGEKPSHFLPKVELIANWLRDNDVDELVSPWIYQEAAWKVAMHGIESPLGLDGILPQDCAMFVEHPAVRACLARGCSKATSLGKVRRIVQVQKAEEAALAEANNQVAQTRSAAEAAKIVQAATTTLQTEVEEDFMLMQIPLPGERQTPSKMTVALQQAARSHPEEVLEALNKRRKVVMCSTFAASGKSVASGVSCWHKFATMVLFYPQDKTLPPVSGFDVSLFICIFNCAGTAKNYVSAIRKACALAAVSTDGWDDEVVKQALRGITSECLRFVGGPSRCKFLLTQVWMDRTLVHLLGQQLWQLACAVGIACEFFLRLQ